MNAPTPGLLREVLIDGTSKGMPPVSDPVPLLEAETQGWTLDDLEPPFVVIRRSALEHNVSLMAGYCDEHRVSIAPHGKTTMAPQLWRRQLDAGAWGIAAATAAQARVMRAMTVTAVMEALGWKHSRLNRVERSATAALPVEDFERLVAVLAARPTGARDDATAHRCRCPH